VRDVTAGAALSPADVRSIRPGFGLPPKNLTEVIGRHAARDLKRGEPLAWEMIAALA
jgi:sialic acid synthase SpsE